MSKLYSLSPTENLHQFWFAGVLHNPRELPERLGLWFFRDEKRDRDVREQFSSWLEEPPSFEDSAKGKLVEILLWDQIPRNAFRGKPESFKHDGRALDLARGLLGNQDFHPLERMFIALPFQHSESLRDQRISLETFRELLSQAHGDLLPFFRVAAEKALQHYQAIERFGRFPHRNQILGRSSTADENEFLTDPRAWF